MRKAVIIYNNGKGDVCFANIPADKLEYSDTHIFVFSESKLVGCFKTEAVVDVHLSDREIKK